MPTYRLDIAYEGSGFYGYARQPNVRTVQGDLEAVLAPYTGGAATAVAGRTDKGVHALQQVVSFTCEPLDTAKVVWSLNRQLKPEIAAQRLTEVAEDFNARFSATGRAYRYAILNSEIHDPLSASIRWAFPEPLDVGKMNEGIACLQGPHDFATFCRRFETRSTERRLDWLAWQRTGENVDLSIGASSFCHQMVRSIVWLSVEVGCGRIAASKVPSILEAQDRAELNGVVPSLGLTLVAVAYEGEPLPRPSWVATTS